MYNNVSREITRGGYQIFRAKHSLLDSCFFEPELQNYSTTALDVIRKGLAKAIPELSEKFNTNAKLPYFGYSVGEGEDRAYIYVQKSNLVIDLHIEPNCASELEKEGFVIKQRDNFQAQAGWLTGWKVPRSSTNIAPVVSWICKAFAN